MNVNNRIPDGNGHLTIKSITEWISGECTANLQLEYEQHCVRCAECREQVAMISQSMQPDEEMVRSTEFQQMLRIGEDVALRVWKEQRELAEPEPEPIVSKPEKKSWLKRLIPARQPSSDPATVLVNSGQASLTQYIWGQPALRLATIAILLLAAGIPGFLYWQNNQPVNGSMASLRQAWNRNRPIETRVTGDFPYLPYIVTRGSGDTVPVNDTKLKSAFAVLALEVETHPTPRAKHALGRLHLLKEEFDDAEKLLKEVVSEEPRNAQAHVDLASVYYERGVKSESPQLFFEAARHLQTATEISPKLAEAWFNLALCHERMLLFTEAKKDWEKYLELDANSQWATEARDRLQKLRERSVLREPQPEKIAAELRAAFAARDEAALRRLLETHYMEVTELSSGLLLDEYLTAAIAHNQEEAARQHQLLRHLAALIRDTKEDHYFVDLVRFVGESSPVRLEKIITIRAQLQQVKKFSEAYQDKQAIELAMTAKAAAESIADVCHTEAALYEIARIYSSEMETKELSLLRQQLLSETIRRRHLQMQVRALLALANQYGAERRMSSWLELDLQALDIAKRLNDADLIVTALRDIEFVYADLGEQEQSFKANFIATQKLYANPLYLNKACLTYINFAQSLAGYGFFQVAQGYQREALQYCKQYKPAVYLNALGSAGKYAALAGQIDESLRLFQQALSESERYSKAVNTQSLAVDLYLSQGDALVKSQRFNEAELAYQKASEKLGSLNNLYYQSVIQHGLAAALLPQGKIPEAEVALNKSIGLIEFSRSNVNAATGRSTFVGSQLTVYKSMVEFQYFYRHSPERAFDFSEKYRSRELLDLINQAQTTAWQEAKQDLKLNTSAQPQSLNEIQQVLPADAQMVEYALTEKHLLIWVINRESWLTENVPITAAQLQALVSEYSQAMRERHELASLNSQSQELYRLLIQPVAGHLKQQQNLVIVPDGVLNSLPFASLVNPASGHYLVEEHTLSVSPSANVLARLLKQSQANRGKPVRSVLAVSDPEFDRQLFPKLSRLPGAQAEVKELPALYQISEELPRAQATKEAFLRKAKNFQVLHLAAHSVINANEPLLSSVVLAVEPHRQTASSESLLLAHEIFMLRLPQTRLVILSSCNSLVNQTAGHNGLGGLAHAFFSAGVPTVIGSLWEVNDESTAGLMTAFHRNWRSSGVSIGQALRQAQLTLLRSANESWRHPANWAAFYVSGDGITV